MTDNIELPPQALFVSDAPDASEIADYGRACYEAGLRARQAPAPVEATVRYAALAEIATFFNLSYADLIEVVDDWEKENPDAIPAAGQQDVEMMRGDHEVIRIWNERARKFGFDGVAGLLNSMRHGEIKSTVSTRAPAPVEVSRLVGEAKARANYAAALSHDTEQRQMQLDACFAAIDRLAAAASTPASLSCGHPHSLMLKSAETGEDLYCELCDALSAKRDAETCEVELMAERDQLRVQLSTPASEVPAGFAMREIRSELQYIHECSERWKEDGQARSITIQATVENIRNLLAATPASPATEPKCACGDRPTSQCEEEWGPSCDLGNNEKHVRVSTVDPAVIDAAIASPATEGEVMWSAEEAQEIRAEGERLFQKFNPADPIEAEAQKPAPLHAYLSKLPTLDPAWPAQVQEGWMKCFDALRAMSGAEAQKAVAWRPKTDFHLDFTGGLPDEKTIAYWKLREIEIEYAYLRPTSSASTEAVALTDEEIADAIIRDIGELPDYTSPDDWPEALMATAGELRTIILGHLSGERGAR